MRRRSSRKRGVRRRIRLDDSLTPGCAFSAARMALNSPSSGIAAFRQRHACHSRSPRSHGRGGNCRTRRWRRCRSRDRLRMSAASAVSRRPGYSAPTSANLSGFRSHSAIRARDHRPHSPARAAPRRLTRSHLRSAPCSYHALHRSQFVPAAGITAASSDKRRRGLEIFRCVHGKLHLDWRRLPLVKPWMRNWPGLQ